MKTVFKLFLTAIFSLLLVSIPSSPLLAQSGPSDPEQIPTIKILLVIYDPILEAQGNVRTHQYFSWNDPVALSSQLVTDLNAKSHGKVKYQIVQTILRDEWPIDVSGQRYTDATYIQETNASNWTHDDGDYNAIITDNAIDTKVNGGSVDEAWLWGGPGFGWWEATTAGNGAYSTNGGPVEGVNSKVFSLMGFNYERGSSEAMESYGHRIEGIMERIYKSWSFPYGPPPAQSPAFLHAWDEFTVKNYDPGTLIGCGFAHGSMNTPTYDQTNNYWSYDWSNTTNVNSTCNDWSNYPLLTGATTNMNCSAWGCTSYGFHQWWWDHMPYKAGTYDGYLANWWRYIVDTEQYKNEGQLTATSVDTDYAENNSASWSCTTVDSTCSLSNESSNKKFGAYSVKLTTGGTDDVSMKYPSAANANWDLRKSSSISFWVYATNTNESGFQDDTIVAIKDSAGNGYSFTHDDTFNPAIGGWRRYEIPLAGNANWTRTSSGTPNLADIDYIQIFTDTYGGGFTLTVDDIGFVRDYSEDNDSQNWACFDDGSFPGCSVSSQTTKVKDGLRSVKHTAPSDATWGFMRYPGLTTGDANWNLTGKTVVFWLYVDSGNFDGASPRVALQSGFSQSTGTYEYTTTTSLVNGAKGRWQRFEIPVEGNSTWTRTSYGSPTLSDIDKLDIYFDNVVSGGYTVYIDGIRFEGRDTSNPSTSITSPANQANVPWSYNIVASASDNTAIKRVDFFQDGQYIGTDALYPYTFFVSHQAWGSHSLTTKAYDIFDNVATSSAISVFQADKLASDPFFSDDFELGFPVGWSGENDGENDLSVGMNGLHGSFSLNSLIDNTTAMYLTDDTANSETAFRSRFYVDPNTITMASGDEFSMTSGRASSASTYHVQLGYYTGTGYRVRSVIYNDAGTATYGNWVPVTDSSHALEVEWKAATSSGANNGYITFWVDGVQQYSQTGIDNDAKRVDEVRFGAVDSIDTGTSGTFFLDDYVTNTSNYIGTIEAATDVSFSDGFESGNKSAWNWVEDAENDLSATTAAALNGTYGLSALVDNTSGMYLKTFVSPDQNRYRARFYMDPNSITMASADTFNVFSGRTSSGWTFSVQLNYSSSAGYRVRTQIYNDAGTATNGAWVNISDASHYIEVDWKASSASGANNGYITLWLDGTSSDTQSGIDNDTKRVNEGRLGAVANVDSGTTGTIYFDKFQANKTEYIGP
jgi:hypothetical protein